MSTLLRPEPALEPRTYVVDPPLTDDELERLCFTSENMQIERTSHGTILVKPPEGGMTSEANSVITYQLGNWWHTHHQGRFLGSGTGFFLADGSMLSPDAAYVMPAQLKGLTKAELARIPHLCPAFVIELLSRTDSLAETRKKMTVWIANGAQLTWLVDPYRRCVEVYEPGLETRVVSSALVRGSGPVDGFTLDANKVWRCFEV